MRPSPVMVAPDMPGVPCSILPSGLMTTSSADQLIDDEADALVADAENHHVTFALLFLSGVMDQPALEVEQRQRLVAHDHHFLTVDDVGTRQVRWKISLTLTSGKANAGCQASPSASA